VTKRRRRRGLVPDKRHQKYRPIGNGDHVRRAGESLVSTRPESAYPAAQHAPHPYMRVPASIGKFTFLFHWGHPWCCFRNGLVRPGRFLLTAEAASPYNGRVLDRSCTRMPHARGLAPVRRDPPETRWLLMPAKDEDGRAPPCRRRHQCRRRQSPPSSCVRYSALIATFAGITPASV
jgi:hypothetical protein